MPRLLFITDGDYRELHQKYIITTSQPHTDTCILCNMHALNPKSCMENLLALSTLYPIEMWVPDTQSQTY